MLRYRLASIQFSLVSAARAQGADMTAEEAADVPGRCCATSGKAKCVWGQGKVRPRASRRLSGLGSASSAVLTNRSCPCCVVSVLRCLRLAPRPGCSLDTCSRLRSAARPQFARIPARPCAKIRSDTGRCRRRRLRQATRHRRQTKPILPPRCARGHPTSCRNTKGTLSYKSSSINSLISLA